MNNVFTNLPDVLSAELFQTIFQSKKIKIERIVSEGHSTPTAEWYNQAQEEWVLILQGAASIQLFGDDNPIQLRVGDHLFIPAHQKHRVSYTSAEEQTIWLAVHIYPDLAV